MITDLFLYNFRNFKELKLAIQAPHVVLHGGNGSGKSNILEAISLFSIGKGLKKASSDEIINIDQQSIGWSSHLTLNKDVLLKTSYKPDIQQKFKKTSFIQETPIKSHTQFKEYLSILWITPETDRLFLDSPSTRRKFVDRFVFAQDVNHLKHVTKYEEAVKERLKLLKTIGLSQSDWLDALEKTIVEEGILIAKARLKLLEKLSTFKPTDDEKTILPIFKAYMEGSFEEILRSSHDDFESIFLQKLKDNRLSDKESGMTRFGPHRSDLFVLHPIKNISVYQCSTGEQKILLLSILIAFIEMFCLNTETLTVFLLDDVIAHLDQNHREILYKRLLKNNLSTFQTWFSGTDIDLFSPLTNNAQYIKIG
jgi:DNA replication and repair protein RecF